MIVSFADGDTAALWTTGRSRRLPTDLHRTILRKLRMIDQAPALSDLRSPPGNRLEALKGDRVGQHSIRVNDQWRVCFRWSEGDAHDVEFCDYH